MNYELRVSNQLVVCGLLFAAALPLLFTLLPPRPQLFKNNDLIAYKIPWSISKSINFFTPDEWLVTDIPERTAWYSAQTSVLLPSDVREFETINDHIRICHGIYFTEKTRNQRFYSDLERLGATRGTWTPLVFGTGIYEDFPLQILHNDASTAPGHLLYLDRNRTEREPPKPEPQPKREPQPAAP